MPVYKIEFYEKTNGECPVFEFLKTLPPKIKAKIDRERLKRRLNIRKIMKRGAGRNELGRISRRDDERPQI